MNSLILAIREHSIEIIRFLFTNKNILIISKSFTIKAYFNGVAWFK